MVMLLFEIVRIDIAAILCMLSLGWSGVLEPDEMLSGFSSSAVFAIISVMIMGHGIARTGVMDRFSGFVVRMAGNNSRKIVAIISLVAGAFSGFVQNVGTAALFIPGVLEVSRRTRIPASALVMPVGFAILLGGTLTMVGTGHLILVNDLIVGAGFEAFGLFVVTPVGIILLFSGIAYFWFLGKRVLPVTEGDMKVISSQEKLIQNLQLPGNIWYNSVGPGSQPEGKTSFARLQDPGESGFAEVLVPSSSGAIGQSVREFSMRRRFAVEPLRLFSRGEETRGDFSDHKFAPGDTIIVYGLWEKIEEMKQSIDFVVATPITGEKRELRRGKTVTAALSFLLAITLALAGFPIAISFFTGAMLMVLAGVMNMQQAYQAVEWKIVFLLAGLIPLGVAMQKTGAADFLAGMIMKAIPGDSTLLLLLSVGVLSTLMSLFVSNIGAIVVLAPMVIGMAEIGGIDPRSLVLMSAICVSNSFILPTQQVNAMLMTPGGYRSRDFLKAGSGLTLLFLFITVTLFFLVYHFNLMR